MYASDIRFLVSAVDEGAPDAAMPSQPSDGDIDKRRPRLGSESTGAQRAVAERLGRRVLGDVREWPGRVVRIPAAACVFAIGIYALTADPRPALLQNAATCTASGAAIYNPAAAICTMDGPGLWAAATQYRRRPLRHHSSSGLSNRVVPPHGANRQTPGRWAPREASGSQLVELALDFISPAVWDVSGGGESCRNGVICQLYHHGAAGHLTERFGAVENVAEILPEGGFVVSDNVF